MDQPGSPSFHRYSSEVSRRGAKGIAPIVFIIGAAIVILATAVVGTYVFLDSANHPNDETASYLPADTDIYFSLNLRPGAEQLQYVRRIISRYTDNPDFQDKVDDLVDTVEDETGIHLLKDVLPWLGPELAIGLIDVGGIADNPQVVAFVGTRDTEAAERVLRRFLDSLEEEEEAGFREGSYKGFITFREVDEEEVNLAITDNYLVFATSERLLEDTIDMMEESVDALSDKAEFKEARDSVMEERFSFLYVDVESIVRQFRVVASAAGAGEALREVEDRLPEILGVSGSFVDRGVRIDGYYNTPPGSNIIPPANSLGSAGLLPDDSLAFLSATGLKEALQEALTELEEDTTLGFDIQEILEGLDQGFSIDIDRDILGWMTGEVAIALLPNSFSSDIFGGLSRAIHALALFQFEERGDTEDALENLVDALENLGVPFDDVEIEGEKATMVDLRGFFGETAYKPGFMFLGNYLVLGTTDLALSMAVSARDGDEPSLSNAEEFSRVVEMAPEGKNALFFLNLKEIVKAALDAQSPSEREDYRENAAPFVDPLRAFLVGMETTSFTLVITIE
ncbi:MAG: DUF3352 domain-containing protein [Chloroflexota bacterium]